MSAGPAIGIRRAAVAAFVSTVALAGCGAPERATFDLPASAAPPRARSLAGRPQFAVNEPQANQPIGSDRIVVRTGPQEVALLGGAQWADRLPRLVQTRLIAAFERAGVGAVLPGAVAERQLSSEIRRFEIDATRGAAVVEISVRVINDRDGAALAARVFVGEAPAPEATGAQAARALEAALDEAARRIVAWARAKV